MDEKEILKIIAQHLEKDVNLNEIHKILAKEHNVKMTYMELRLLSADIENMDWSKFDPKVKEEEEEIKEAVELIPQEATQIEVSKIQRPGAMYSGSVTFLSGMKGEWHIDQYGALGLNLADESQQPSEDDMQDFQTLLQQQLSGSQ
jgi:DNA-binding transcriptional MerR regulator